MIHRVRIFLFFAIGLGVFSQFSCSHAEKSTLLRSPTGEVISEFELPYFLRERAPIGGLKSAGAECLSARQCQSYLCVSGKCAKREFLKGCVNIGYACAKDSVCCSQRCEDGICKSAPKKNCAYVNQFCDSSAQCCSGRCEMREHRCAGTSTECSLVDQKCSKSTECCSGKCDLYRGRCQASPLDPSREGESCENKSQCLSDECDLDNGTCK